ncbi:hypothetical protein BH10BDE1_BH10BDE1_14100 [soil metagenome]
MTSFVLTAILSFVSIAMPRASAAPIDPLSRGPLPLTDKNIAAARASYEDGLIYTDKECFLKPEDIAATEIALPELASDICKNRTQELVYVASKSVIVGCATNTAEFAMRVSIGTNGIGKTAEGNRKSPLGTYWIGYPRHSMQFGIFIPIGYPNMANIAAGFTGYAVGIHGPMRFMTCLPQKSLEKNWTAGCFAVGRDSQIIQLSEWILAHWPAKLTITRN